MQIKNGRVFLADGTFADTTIDIENGRVSALGAPGTDGALDAQGGYVIPGLIDIHTHGAVGHDFSDGGVEDIQAMAQYLASQGITSFLGTTMSLGLEELCRVAASATAYMKSPSPGTAALRGINMEGPFFSIAKKGAQSAEHILPPDHAFYRRIQDASGNAVRLADLAPELPGAMEFISQVSRECRVSIAHTEADYDTAVRAFEAGASHVTHLFNAMPPFTHRAPGVVGAAADHAQSVELISDGFHIHPSVVRSVFRMFGEDRVCLISDSMRACGMPDGTYTLGGQTVLVHRGKATLENGTLAGSTTNLMECLRRAVSFGVPLTAAVKAATMNPARAAGILDTVGTLEPGKQADLVILDSELRLRQVMIQGKTILQAE